MKLNFSFALALTSQNNLNCFSSIFERNAMNEKLRRTEK